MAVTNVPSPPRRCCQRGTHQEVKIHLAAHNVAKKKKRKRNILSFVLSETCALLLNVRLGERPSRALPLVICYLWLLLASSRPLRPTVL